MFLSLFLIIVIIYISKNRLTLQNKKILLYVAVISCCILILNIMYMININNSILHVSDGIGYYEWGILFLHDYSFPPGLNFKYYGFILFNSLSIFPYVNQNTSVSFIYFNHLLISLFVFINLLLHIQNTLRNNTITKSTILLYISYFLVFNYFIVFNLRELIMMSLLLLLLLVLKSTYKNKIFIAVIILFIFIFFRPSFLVYMLVAFLITYSVFKFFKFFIINIVLLISIGIYIIPTYIDFSNPINNPRPFLQKIYNEIVIPSSGVPGYKERKRLVKNTTGSERGKLFSKIYFQRLPSLIFSYYPERYMKDYVNNDNTIIQNIMKVLLASIFIYFIYPVLFTLLVQYNRIKINFLFAWLISFFIVTTGIYLIKFDTVALRIVLLFFPLFLLEIYEYRYNINYKLVSVFALIIFTMTFFINELKSFYFGVIT